MPHPQPSPGASVGASQWQSASACGPNGGNCVEVNLSLPHGVGVRDSKGLTGDVILEFSPATWANFMTATRAGHFDRH